VDRSDDESVWLRSPDLADVSVGCEATEGLVTAYEVIGGHEVAEMDA
jgi:hypothetical protein